MKQVHILIFSLNLLSFIFCEKTTNFGHYFLNPLEIIRCNLSNPIDVQHAVGFNIFIDNSEAVKGNLKGYMHISSDFQYKKGVFTLDVWKNDKYENIILRKSQNICTDLILSFPIRMIVKPDKNCIGRSGNYSVDININRYMHSIVGKNFFYQKIHSKLEYFSKAGSIFCLEVLATTESI